MVTLVYHKKLSEELEIMVSKISNKLGIQLIARAKNEFYSSGNGFLEDIIEGTDITLYQTDQSFYQPNHFMMPRMVQKVIQMIKKPKDLLELYCGSGTFTIPMSRCFNKVFATENNRASITYLNKSINKNKVTNVLQSRISDTELTEAFNGRKFRRMGEINLSDYDFSHVLVDPPRSGLNENVTDILNKFKNIIYIS